MGTPKTSSTKTKARATSKTTPPPRDAKSKGRDITLEAVIASFGTAEFEKALAKYGASYDALEFCLVVMRSPLAMLKTRLTAASIAIQYTHAKKLPVGGTGETDAETLANAVRQCLDAADKSVGGA